MRKQVFIAVAILVALAVVPNLLCQTVPRYFLNSTVFIEYQVDAAGASSGTGLIIFDQNAHDIALNTYSYYIFLVTNKHVLPPEHGFAKEMKVRFGARNESNQVTASEMRIPVLDAGGKYLREVVLHPDPAVDVAVVFIGGDLFRARAEALYRMSEKHEAITTDLLVRRDKLAEAQIGIGTEVYTLGYPAGIYGAQNVSPMLRLGIIATDPDTDFSFSPEFSVRYGLPQTVSGFLIDSNVFPGSSGSLVFRRTEIVPGWSIGGEFSRPYVLGILAKSIPVLDLWGLERMGVGVVYSAETIRDTIALAVRKLFPKPSAK